MRFISAILAAGSCAALWCAGEDLFIEVESQGIQKMDIAVCAFARKGAADPGKVIVSDLKFSGRFNVTEVKEADTAFLRGKGIPVLIDGKTGADGDKITLECFLRDANTLNLIVGKQYTVKEAEARRAAHLFSDEVVYRLFGEKGIAATRIVCVAQAGKAKEICMVDYDGAGLTRLTSNNQLNLSPRFSPDNQAVVYTSYRQKTPALWVSQIYTGKTARLTLNNRLNFAPAWNPVDDCIAFATSLTGECDIYTMDPDGGNLKRLTLTEAIESSPCWSPNGYEIAYTSDRTGNPQIYIMDNEGGNARRLTYEGRYNDSPCWSPKGDKIAYVSMEGSRFDVCTLDLDGSNVKRLTQGPGSNEHPGFSPDGRLLVFSSTRAGGSDLYLMGLDGADQTRITFSGNLSSPAWSGYYP